MSRRPAGLAGLAAVIAAALALGAVELGRGAADYGEFPAANPCTARISFPGDGVDPAIQRIALSGLNGAACELGATREELVLSFVPGAGGPPIRWDRPTIERAVRAGLERAIDDAERSGSISSFTAFLLREIAARAPIDWLISGAENIVEFAQDIDQQGFAATIRDRLEEAIAEAERNGRLGSFEARLLRRAVDLAPIDWLVRQAERLLG